MKSAKKSKLITIVESDTIFFVFMASDGSQKIFQKIALDDFLSQDAENTVIPTEVLEKTNALMIVPDYWMGNNYYNFLSKKKSLIAPFVERKLIADVPGIDEIHDFYGYTNFKSALQDQNLHVFYLQEPTAYSVYHRLSDLGLSPVRITAPALLWQHKLALHEKNFDEGGKGLVHLEEKNCYLYFFFHGQSLFSRRIALPETPIDDEEKINLLNYEVNQSFYLFSQKTKNSVDAIYFVSDEKDIIDPFSDTLNKQIIVCDTKAPEMPSDILKIDLLDVVKPFVDKEISPDESFLSITYKPLHQQLEWQPIQNMGIALGVLLLIFIVSEILFLKTGFDNDFLPTAHARSYGNPKQTLRMHIDAIDKVMEDRSRPSLSRMMVSLCAALPDQTSIKKAMFNTDSPSVVQIEAAIRANGPEHFKKILSQFLANFNQRLTPVNPLSEKDIDVHMDHQNTGHGTIQYIIKFKAELS